MHRTGGASRTSTRRSKCARTCDAAATGSLPSSGRDATSTAGQGGWCRAVDAEAALWVAWPRKAGGHASDVTEQALRDTFLPVDLVDNKVAAIDDDWSGLRFVWRRERRGAIADGP